MSEMEQYITKSTKDKLAVGGMGVLLLALGIVVLATQRNLMALVPVFMGGFCVYAGLTAGSSDRKELQKLEDEGALSKAEADFLTAVPVADDRARIGEEFIFRRLYAKVLRCRDVKKVYYGEHEDGDDHPSTIGEVYLKMENGREEKLFESSSGNARGEAIRSAQLLLERNPDIEVNIPQFGGIIGDAIHLVKKMKDKHKEE